MIDNDIVCNDARNDTKCLRENERASVFYVCLMRLNNAAIHTAQRVWERLYENAAKSDVFASNDTVEE